MRSKRRGEVIQKVPGRQGFQRGEKERANGKYESRCADCVLTFHLPIPALCLCPSENAIPIETWIDEPHDEALLDLLPFLDALRFTKVCSEKLANSANLNCQGGLLTPSFHLLCCCLSARTCALC